MAQVRHIVVAHFIFDIEAAQCRFIQFNQTSSSLRVALSAESMSLYLC
jgi:hypothetical protein